MANRHKPTWNQIVAFNAAVHSGSISKAAKYLGVTQPAVTSQVRSIERQFNVKLFTRSAAGVELTAQGIKLFAATNGATEIECAAREALSDSTAVDQIKNMAKLDGLICA